MKKVLSIAGSDCSGGAGIQADLKTFSAHKIYGMSAITALTAQNTMGVSSIVDVDKDFIQQQLDAIFTDIRPDAIKIGMVSQPYIIEGIIEKLKKYNATNIVVDPVMIATSSASLINDAAYQKLTSELIPLATLITPNIYEGSVLAQMDIKNVDDMIIASKIIFNKYKVPVLLKGGHMNNSCDDLLYDGNIHWFEGEYINNPNTHGTGCTLSSAIACNLAMNHDLVTSITNAKDYLTNCLKAQLDLGHDSGPLNHVIDYDVK